MNPYVDMQTNWLQKLAIVVVVGEGRRGFVCMNATHVWRRTANFHGACYGGR
jgi:hypothetical protein